MATPTILTLPPGRLVKGSLYKANTTDAEGKPLVTKSGPNAGQPRNDFYCEIAVPKGAEQHWAHTPWGGEMWRIGTTAFPQQSQRPDFAWKVIDGDSTIPNKNGKVPNQQAGYPGCWVLRLSSGYKSPLFIQSGGQWVQVQQDDYANPGDFVQAQITVNDNGSQQQAGIYINHRMFAFIGYGERIFSGPDANSAGFGQAPLPAGASATPPAGAPMPAMPAPPGAAAPAPLIPGLPGAPGAPMPPPAAPMAPPQPPAPPMPAAPADPLVGVPGAAHTVAGLRAAGWSDDQIVSGGYATRAAAPAPAPLPPGSSVPAPGAPAAPIAPAMGVIPNPAFPQIPAAPATPQLTAAGAALGTYDSFRAQGWQDAQMRAAGYLA